MATSSILVVDDFRPWRRLVRSLVERNPLFQVTGEASDGQEAIAKAIELQPDIILLDLEMPVLNGIEACKIIRRRCPRSKILFVTQERDSDVRNEAMRTGAVGFVLKSNAACEIVDVMLGVLNPLSKSVANV